MTTDQRSSSSAAASPAPRPPRSSATRGTTATVTLVGAEPHLPYERPPLSKGYLLGNDELDDGVRARRRSGTTSTTSTCGSARRSPRSTSTRRTGHGRAATELAYDRLLLATGSRAAAARAGRRERRRRRLPAHARRLRSRSSEHLGGPAPRGHRRRLDRARGGRRGPRRRRRGHRGRGARAAAAAACSGPRWRASFADLHREHGVDLRLGTGVEAIRADGDRAAVRLADGHEPSRPTWSWSASAPRPTSTSPRRPASRSTTASSSTRACAAGDPDVFAAGDVANAEHPCSGAGSGSSTGTPPSSRARTSARAMLGEDAAYDRLPYFFTDQYDLGMEYIGNVGPEGYDEVVVRGDDAGARVHRVLARTAAGSGRDARQRLGRDRPDPRPGRPGGRRGALRDENVDLHRRRH